MSNAPEDCCFSVVFGASVGKFKLGTHVNDVLEYFSNEHPRLQLNVSFSDISDMNAVDIHVNVPQWGIRLRFQPHSQQLYFIDIHNFNVPISFNINGYIIRGQEHATTFSHLQKALGPSFPGKFIDEGKYLLSFGGVGIIFRLPAQFQALFADGKALPVMLPDKSSPVLERIYVHARELDVEHSDAFPDVLATTCEIVLQDQAAGQCGERAMPLGSHLHLLSNRNSPSSREGEACAGSGGCCLSLGMMPQDVVSSLGTPDFASLSPQHVEAFIHKYEYKRLGIELHFSKNTHVVFRIVAHTNLAQHQDFGRFRRCGFSLSRASPRSCEAAACEAFSEPALPTPVPRCPPEEELEKDSHDDDELHQGASASSKKSKKQNQVEESEQQKKEHQYCSEVSGTCGRSVSAVTPWDETQALLAQWFPSSGSSHNQRAAIKPVPAGCPFPASQLHAFPSLHAMFEVSAAGTLCSVTLLDLRLVET